jgi:hypothetical protein
VDGDGDIEAKGVVVQDVDGEEEDDVRHPTDQGNAVWDKEKRGVVPGEMCIVAMECD